MLGVIIGVAAVILLVAIGSGVQQEITGQIEGLGSQPALRVPRATSREAAAAGPGARAPRSASGSRWTTPSWCERRLGDEAIVVPVVQGPATLKAGNRTLRTTIAAATENGDEVFNADYVSGRHYNRSEYATAARVLMLGRDAGRASSSRARTPSAAS